MKTLNTYITEKFKISKDIKTDKYNIGDYCLAISLYNWASPHFNNNDAKVCIGLDILKLTDIDKQENKISKIFGDYITTYHHTNTHGIVKLENTAKDSSKYIYSKIYDLLLEVIIPEEEALNILKHIEKNKTFNILKKMEEVPEGFENLNKEIPISFEKKDVTKITYSNEIDFLIKSYEENKFISN